MTDIKMNPLVSYQIGPIAQTAIALLLHLAPEGADLRALIAGTAPTLDVNLALSPAQALDLADHLRKTAERILAEPPPPRSDQH